MGVERDGRHSRPSIQAIYPSLCALLTEIVAAAVPLSQPNFTQSGNVPAGLLGCYIQLFCEVRDIHPFLTKKVEDSPPVLT